MSARDDVPSERRTVRAVRDSEAGAMLELLFVAAVSSVLLIRAALAATGYPQLGGHGLHIAHMLWGGLLLLVACGLLLSYWSPSVRRAAALVAGVGFGTFIDELGKFITSDNDYCFRPTIALLYIVFTLLFLVVRSVARGSLTPREAVLNAELRRALGDRGAFSAPRYRALRAALDHAYAE